jgi:long-subunit acyl-CoA synthetase (AMP-forming)
MSVPTRSSGIDAPSVLNRVAAGGASAAHHVTVYQSGGPVRLSLAELDRRAGEVARYFLRRGIGPGDRVGIMARNRLEWLLADLACVKIKAVSAGFEPGKFGAPADLADRYGLKLVLTDRPDPDPRVLPIAELRHADAEPDIPLPPVTYRPDDVVTIKFTSGSTGEPKGLGATAGSVDDSINAVQSEFDHGPDDSLFVFLPLSLLQQRYWIYSALAFGHDIVVAGYELAFHALKREQPTVIMGVPGFFESLRREIGRRPVDGVGEPDTPVDLPRRARQVLGARIRYLWTGSAPAGPSLLEFYDACDVPIYEGYGLNETCITTKNTPAAHRVGSVGRPLPGKRVRIDTDGVVVVSSEHPVNTRYLYSEPGASDAVFLPDGSVRTGDLGRIDADGFLYILGRADDVVVLRNGRNVLVRPVEERLRDSAAIDDCVVVGFGQDYLVAVICPSATGTAAEIEAHIRETNRRGGADERIGGHVRAAEPFGIDNGLLTSQYKPRRREITARYHDAIHRIYEGAR